MDWVSWWAIVHGVTKSCTLEQLAQHSTKSKGRQKICMQRTVRRWWKKPKTTQTDGEIHHVLVCLLLFSHSVFHNSLWPHGLQSARLSVHGISHSRILEWDAISFPSGLSEHRDQNWISTSPVLQADSLPPTLLYYPKQSTDSMQSLSNYQWHFSQN